MNKKDLSESDIKTMVKKVETLMQKCQALEEDIKT
jgi:hypothetical protein